VGVSGIMQGCGKKCPPLVFLKTDERGYDQSSLAPERHTTLPARGEGLDLGKVRDVSYMLFGGFECLSRSIS